MNSIEGQPFQVHLQVRRLQVRRLQVRRLLQLPGQPVHGVRLPYVPGMQVRHWQALGWLLPDWSQDLHLVLRSRALLLHLLLAPELLWPVLGSADSQS